MANRNPISNAFVIYLILILIGFVFGTFPQLIQPESQYDSPVRYSLLGVFFAQVFYFMIISPLVWMRRSERKVRPIAVLFETILMLVATIPFYISATWLSDAGWNRFLIPAIVLLSVIIWSMLCSKLILKTHKSWAIILIFNILATLGTLSAIYIKMEFL